MTIVLGNLSGLLRLKSFDKLIKTCKKTNNQLETFSRAYQYGGSY